MEQVQTAQASRLQNCGMTWLRIFCALQVYAIHYFAGHGLRDYIWIFSLAVPAFLLMSAYLYGLRRNPDTKYGFGFLKKRLFAITSVTYPLLLAVFLYWSLLDPSKIHQLSLSLIGEMTFLHEIIAPHLPGMGHLWFLQTLLVCYIVMAVTTHVPLFEKFFTSIKTVIFMFGLVIACGWIYRGIILPYVFFYLLVYYNAKKIQTWTSLGSWILIILICLHFILASLNYPSMFHQGIYLYYLQTSLFSLALIVLFQKYSFFLGGNNMVQYMGELTMAFYLIHHLYAYDWSLFSGLAITITSSIVLHWIGDKIKTVLFRYC